MICWYLRVGVFFYAFNVHLVSVVEIATPCSFIQFDTHLEVKVIPCNKYNVIHGGQLVGMWLEG